MSLSNTQVTVGGIIFNEVDSAGVKWRLTQFDGWNGSSASKGDPVEKTRRSGAFWGDSYSTGRVMSLGGTIAAPTADALNTALDQLSAAFALADQVMTVNESNVPRWVSVRRDDELLAPKLSTRVAKFSVQVESTDWRKFTTSLVGFTSLASSSGGTTFPESYPLMFTGTTAAGSVSLTNLGNTTGPVWLRVDGPCHGPIITHVNSGRSVKFASSLVLGSGEWLSIDMEGQEVLANGQTSRATWVTERGWSGFDPGVNTWTFTAAQFDAGAQLSVTATPSYL